VIRRILDGWIGSTRLDYPLVLIAAAAAAVSNQAPPAERIAWYQTLVGAFGVLLTLGAITVTLVFTVTPTDRLVNVYRHLGAGVERLLMACLGGVLVAMVGVALVFLLDPSDDRRLLAAGTWAFIVLASLRFGRLWWLLRKILQALMAGYATDASETPSASSETPSRDWERPSIGDGDYRPPSRQPRAP
jgi:hypothetical protein